MEIQNQELEPVVGKKGSRAWVWVLLLIIFLIIASLVIYLLFFNGWTKVKQRWAEKNPSPNIESSLNAGTSNVSTNSGEYGKLVGEWTTACLVPDANSPWAEKHRFTFESSGAAKHIRWSGDSCGSLAEDTFSQTYKVEIPQVGKVNFLTDGSGSESMYDIYQITGSKLYFGHGFRVTYPPGMVNFGRSSETRFDSLNTFIEYNK